MVARRVGRPLVGLDLAHDSTSGFEPATAIPECPTDLGVEPGGSRKHDLVILGRTGGGRPVLAAVEAKTDEPFDERLEQRVTKARALLDRGAATRQLDRVQRLARGVFGRPVVRDDGSLDDELKSIPYQLLAGIEGTAIEADHREAEIAIFAVHAFHSPGLNVAAVQENRDAFTRFVAAMAHEPFQVSEGVLYGPFTLPGGEGIPRRDVLVGMTTSRL